MIVLFEDARQAQYCSSGLREFFGENNLSWADFVANGIEHTRLPADNPMVKIVIHNAEERINGRGR